ncbi:MAG: hypothetical protein ACRENA_03610 [Vulcanimicrobiaceae bacterium]
MRSASAFAVRKRAGRSAGASLLARRMTASAVGALRASMPIAAIHTTAQAAANAIASAVCIVIERYAAAPSLFLSVVFLSLLFFSPSPDEDAGGDVDAGSLFFVSVFSLSPDELDFLRESVT